MSLYKRRRSKERPMSLFNGNISPVLQGSHSSSLVMSQSMSFSAQSDCSYLDTTLTSYNSEYYGDGDYELEITELQCSPTFSGRKVWNFLTPRQSPVSDRQSRNSSGTPSPDTTPVVRDHESIKDSVPPSPTSSVSSTLQQFALKLRSHSSSALEHSGNSRRYMVISEIIDTERKYIHSLETLLNIHLQALTHVVAPRDLRLLFPAQLEPLIEQHSNLLEMLEERMSENTCFPGIVGDVFARLLKESNSDFLQMYSAYMNEFKVAMTTLVKYDNSSVQFKELLLLCQHSPSCEGLSLASYLLTPIQRLPRYELLLKELLRQTPLDHPDNFYVCDAIDRIHAELVRLNQSIKSCQLACSVRRANNYRKTSFRVRTSRALAKLKRHVSTANIDDYSSGDSSPGPEIRPARIVRRRRANLKATIYRSEENLLSVDQDEDGEDVRQHFHANSLMNIRPATSCSDLMLGFDRDEMKHKPFSLLAPLESLPVTPEPSPRPTSPSESSINLLTSEESCRTRSRVSIYSTASSTSGIGSIGNSQFDLRVGSLTPTELNSDPMSSTPVLFRVKTPRPEFSSSISVGEASDRRKKGLKRMSWTSALKILNWKKTGRSMSASKVLDIGSPKNFRHIQHGFPPLAENVEFNHPLSQCKSSTNSDNTLDGVHL